MPVSLDGFGKAQSQRTPLVRLGCFFYWKAQISPNKHPLTLFAQLIDGVQLNETKDDIFWRFGKHDDYSVKSAYMLNFLAVLPTNFRGAIWKGWAPAECKFFI
jgi:hypothetical protein